MRTPRPTGVRTSRRPRDYRHRAVVGVRMVASGFLGREVGEGWMVLHETRRR